jgi:hypothetical protein
MMGGYRFDREDRRCGSPLPPSRLLRRGDLTSSLWHFRIASIKSVGLLAWWAALVTRVAKGTAYAKPIRTS